MLNPRLSPFAAAVLALVLGCSGIAVAAQAVATKPIRHLVYGFTLSIASDLTLHDSGFSSGTGITDDLASADDQGTITVNVLQVAADGGLVVNVSEHARNTRSAKPALCAVYGDGGALCAAGAKVNAEEFALLRLVGALAPASSEFTHRHWQEIATGPGFKETSDFTVTKNAGGMLTVALQRVATATGVHGFTAATTGTIYYNLPLTVPTTLDQTTVTRSQRGMGREDTVTTQMSLRLNTDSMQPGLGRCYDSSPWCGARTTPSLQKGS